MRKRFKFEVLVPEDATDDEIEAWVEYRLHYNGSLSGDNPLCDYDLDAEWVEEIPC